jgi:hypothetical protein
MAAENDTWTRGDMVERLRLNDKGITDFGGSHPQVPPLRDYRELQNYDVMQIFRLYGGSAVPLIKQLVPLLRNAGPREIAKKYKDGSHKHTLVERRKKAHRGIENFKAGGFVRAALYFGPEVPPEGDYNEESLNTRVAKRSHNGSPRGLHARPQAVAAHGADGSWRGLARPCRNGYCSAEGTDTYACWIRRAPGRNSMRRRASGRRARFNCRKCVLHRITALPPSEFVL